MSRICFLSSASVLATGEGGGAVGRATNHEGRARWLARGATANADEGSPNSGWRPTTEASAARRVTRGAGSNRERREGVEFR